MVVPSSGEMENLGVDHHQVEKGGQAERAVQDTYPQDHRDTNQAVLVGCEDLTSS